MAYRFLVVDDSSVVRKALRKTLAMTDIQLGELLEAENGQLGLDVLNKEWVDLVFLDINMPVMNGVEFLKAVRSNPDFKETPVIIVSTEGSTERIKELEELGIQAYLRKPVSPEELVSKVQELLGGI